MLSQAQIDAALTYNRGRGYNQLQVTTIQSVVGLTRIPDGVWSADTVTAVCKWQVLHGLLADGKVGQQTWTRISEENQHKVGASYANRPRVVEIGLGLAAYDQEWPGHTPQEAMQVAFDAALAERPVIIGYWSSDHLIQDMGSRGNVYSGAFVEQLRSPIPISVWVDDAPGVAKTSLFAKRLSDMHVRQADIMINHSNTHAHDAPWSLRWTDAALAQAAESYAHYGIDRVCVAWARPSRSQIDAMIHDMERILDVSGAVAMQVEIEENWTDDFLVGFPSMAAAANYLIAGMDHIRKGRRREMTTYTYHRENGPGSVLTPLMDRTVIQAYSVRHRNTGVVDWADVLGPGRHQRLAMSRTLQAVHAA